MVKKLRHERMTRVLASAILVLAISPSSSPPSTASTEPSSASDPYGTAALGRAFAEKLLSVEGGVFSFLQVGQQEDPNKAGTGHDRLLESAGAVLARAVAADDSSVFKLVAGHYRKRFRTQAGLSPWRLDSEDQPTRSADGSYSSAPIDELRIAGALLAGTSVFGEPSYADDAATVARSLTTAVRDGLLTSNVSWNPGPPAAGHRVALSYLDVPTMRLLARFESAWGPVADRAIPLLKDAITDSGLPEQIYNPATGQYECRQVCETTPGLYSALHLAGAGERGAAIRILRFYLARIQAEGRLDDGYTPAGAGSGNEELAAYALLARLAERLDEAEQARTIVDGSILPHRIASGPAAGLFSYSSDDASAFDNLEILLTLGELEGRRPPAD
jgi:hypothetical protein